MIYNSFILSFVFSILQKLQEAYSSSRTAAFFRGIASGFKEVISKSALWNFVKRESYFTGISEYSLLYRFLSWICNLPSRTCRNIYKKHELVFSNSLFFKALQFIFSRFEILIGISLALIVIVPHQYWNNAYSFVIALLLVFLYAVKAVYEKNDFFNIKALDMALLLFIAAVFMAVPTSVLPEKSGRMLIFYLTCIFFVLVLASAVKSGKALYTLLEIITVAIAITGLAGVWQAILGVAVDVSQVDIRINSNLIGRIYSTVENPNNYAEILIMMMPFMLAVILNSKGWVNKAKYLFLLALPVIALTRTGSRSGMLVFAGSMLIFLFLKNRKLIPLAIVLGIVCFPLLPPSLVNRLMTVFNSNDKSIGYRGLIYQTVLPMFKDFWVYGVGLGNDPFTTVIQRYFLWTGVIPPHTHNLFLQIWIETGIAGILSFVWFIIRIVKRCLTSIFSKTDDPVKNILIAGVSSLAGILVMSVAEYSWFYPRVMLFFWVDIGIILAALNILARKKETGGTI